MVTPAAKLAGASASAAAAALQAEAATSSKVEGAAATGARPPGATAERPEGAAGAAGGTTGEPASRRLLAPSRHSRTLRAASASASPATPPSPPPSGTGGAPQLNYPLTRRTALVNFSPFLGRAALSFAVNRNAPLSHQLAAWRAVLAAVEAEAMWANMLDPLVLSSPVRDSHMSQRNIQRWTGAGYDEGDAMSYLSALQVWPGRDGTGRTSPSGAARTPGLR